MIRIPNKKDISRLRNTNSDLINLKENYSYFRTTISSNALQSFNNTTEIKNQRYKIKTIDSIHNNLINDNKIYNKGKTQSESFWPYKKNNYIKNYLSKIRKKIEKKKSFKTERTKDNKIIYYNSSIEDKYNNKKKNKIFESGLNNINLGKSASNFKSDDVNFIHKIINLYKIKKQSYERNNRYNNSEIENINIKRKKINNENNKTEEINQTMLKGFALLAGNKSALKTLFKKTPIKIKDCFPLLDSELNSELYLNPFNNSYGEVLKSLSSKIGFMKDSINLIYPKISKAKYSFNDIKKEFDSTNRLYRSSIFDIKKNNNLLYKIKNKKFNQTLYSKYPINVSKSSEQILSSRMYSLRRVKK